MNHIIHTMWFWTPLTFMIWTRTVIPNINTEVEVNNMSKLLE